MSGNKSAMIRLKKELEELKKNPIPEMTVEPNAEVILHWEGVLNGPKDTPYSGGVFKFTIDFPADYPMRAPKVKFLTKIFHPNIDPFSGNICVDILQDEWTPSYSITAIMLSVLSLLTDPNPNSPLNSQSATLFLTNRDQYNNEVIKWVQMYAKP